jgi:hypothetical protein
MHLVCQGVSDCVRAEIAFTSVESPTNEPIYVTTGRIRLLHELEPHVTSFVSDIK